MRIFGDRAIFPGFPGEELPVPLFKLIPLMPLVKDGGKAHDQQQRDKKDYRVEILAIGFYLGPFIPTGDKIDDDGYHKGESNGDSYQKLGNDLFTTEPVSRPIPDEVFFLLCQHEANYEEVDYL